MTSLSRTTTAPAAAPISVLPATSTTLFGQSVTANTLTTLLSGLDDPMGLALDTSGDLYYATQNGVSVLPLASGTVFGRW